MEHIEMTVEKANHIDADSWQQKDRKCVNIMI